MITKLQVLLSWEPQYQLIGHRTIFCNSYSCSYQATTNTKIEISCPLVAPFLSISGLDMYCNVKIFSSFLAFELLEWLISVCKRIDGALQHICHDSRYRQSKLDGKSRSGSGTYRRCVWVTSTCFRCKLPISPTCTLASPYLIWSCYGKFHENLRGF